MLKFLDVFRKNRDIQTESPERALFLKKFQHFQNLLAGNNHALELIAELEQLCYGAKPFTLETVIERVERLMAQVYDIAEDLNDLSGGKYSTLPEAVERIGAEIFEDLARKRNVEKTSLTIALGRISREQLAEVGGKSANLGEDSESRSSAGACGICRYGLRLPSFFAVKRALQDGAGNPEGPEHRGHFAACGLQQ